MPAGPHVVFFDQTRIIATCRAEVQCWLSYRVNSQEPVAAIHHPSATLNKSLVLSSIEFQPHNRFNCSNNGLRNWQIGNAYCFISNNGRFTTLSYDTKKDCCFVAWCFVKDWWRNLWATWKALNPIFHTVALKMGQVIILKNCGIPRHVAKKLHCLSKTTTDGQRHHTIDRCCNSTSINLTSV